MEEVKEELKRCSHCKSTMLLSYYDKNKKGEYFKTCNTCRYKHKCKLCEYKSYNISHVKKHVEGVHDKIKKIKCDLCDFRCVTNSHLKSHVKQVHDQIKNIFCVHCDFKCSTNGILKAHIYNIHINIKIKQIKCRICKLEFLTKNELTTHRNDIHIFNCDLCDYKNSKKCEVRKHYIYVHDKIKNIKCTFEGCDYKCGRQQGLNTHIKQVHDKIKDIKCDLCDYKCSTTSHLKTHVMCVHDKIKNFKCTFEGCDYKCALKSTVLLHINRIHNKIKNFKCTIEKCDYKCASSSQLKSHVQICTGNKNCSSGEFSIMAVLDEMKIPYEYNSTFKIKDKGFLFWDFNIDFNDKKLFIEFNGRQHYEFVQFGGTSIEKAKLNLVDQQRKDQLKDDFCKENNYPLLWIKYTDYGKIKELVSNFIISNTSWDGDGYESDSSSSSSLSSGSSSSDE